MSETKTAEENPLQYWKENCKENYINTPISVLRYIAVLEQQNQELQRQVEELKEWKSKAIDIAQKLENWKDNLNRECDYQQTIINKQLKEIIMLNELLDNELTASVHYVGEIKAVNSKYTKLKEAADDMAASLDKDSRSLKAYKKLMMV